LSINCDLIIYYCSYFVHQSSDWLLRIDCKKYCYYICNFDQQSPFICELSTWWLKFYFITLWILTLINCIKRFSFLFMAPSGAQEMLMSVRSSVRPVQVCLKLLIFNFKAQIYVQHTRERSLDLNMTSHSPILLGLRSVSGWSQVSISSLSRLRLAVWA